MLKVKSTVKLNFSEKSVYSLYNKKIKVGVFSTDLRKQPNRGALGSFAGIGSKTKIKPKASKSSFNEVALKMQKRFGFLTIPFLKPDEQAKAILQEFALLQNTELQVESKKNILANSLISVVLQAVKKNRFGSNSKKTIKFKGFNKILLDTGQTLKKLEGVLTTPKLVKFKKRK